MPILRNTPRQESTALTTQPSNLVAVRPPLHQILVTTISILSFWPTTLFFLQYSWKNTNSTLFNSNRSGRQSSNYRLYVANLPTICGDLQNYWLLCGTSSRLRHILLILSRLCCNLQHVFDPFNLRFLRSHILAPSQILKSDFLTADPRNYGMFFLRSFSRNRAPKWEVAGGRKVPQDSADLYFGFVRREVRN